MEKCACPRFREPVRSYSDLLERCARADEISAPLEVLEADDEGWRKLLRCVHRRSLWLAEFPFSERHGGGPACYSPLPSEPAIGPGR
jgi:hypothetical protein